MSCGIYSLNFANTDKKYIGQSINIERRFTQHIYNIKNGFSNHKLLDAFKMYGIPKLNILIECSPSELDLLEEKYINEFNSVNNGFNIYTFSNQAPILKGTLAGNSRYSRTAIINCINYLRDNIDTLNNAAKLFNIGKDTLYNIICGKQHLWVLEEYSYDISIIKDNIEKANKLEIVNWPKNNLKVSVVRPNYKKVISPDGKIFTVDNINEFARNNRTISKSSLHRLLSGQVNVTKGWKLCQDDKV